MDGLIVYKFKSITQRLQVEEFNLNQVVNCSQGFFLVIFSEFERTHTENFQIVPSDYVSRD